MPAAVERMMEIRGRRFRVDHDPRERIAALRVERCCCSMTGRAEIWIAVIPEVEFVAFG
jgi:hypothetical protein